jgi:uncharacterized protein YydD (DUF2326 family)
LDLALLSLTADAKRGPRFLIRDSHLFDSVDERQVSKAMQLGNATADRIDGQYLVTMNSDIFDRRPLPAAFDKEAHLLSTRMWTTSCRPKIRIDCQIADICVTWI